MLRRLHRDQPETFAFSPANQAWAEAQMTKYPEGRQASAIIALLWRAQEQEGWLTRPAIEHIAEMLGLAYIRALEVATFYFMFQLQPVGRAAHIQICGTTPCMLRGSEDLVAVCKEKIAARPHEISGDGMLSWEEVECLGACSNAPMAQIGKDYYEDLTAEGLGDLLERMRAGEVPTPGPQNDRWASEPEGGLTALTDQATDRDHESNASVSLATEIGDTLKRIDGTEVPLRTPWRGAEQADPHPETAAREAGRQPDGPDGRPGGRTLDDEPAPRERGDSSDGYANVRGSEGDAKGRPDEGEVAPEKKGEGDFHAGSRDPVVTGTTDSDGEPEGTETAPESLAVPADAIKPAALNAPHGGVADDLTRINGIGPKLANTLNDLGFWHFDQIASWSDREAAWVDAQLEGVKGRVTRDEWVKQAKVLFEGEES
ncbi:NADH-quinone oxidoreductase chain 2 [Jannaschia seosinensis]|uniref:NADH-quinone oxidoreductase chain 2 n=1 Tax=Jannaschia seosinensis TaxID=313367 RepID=A0A0M7B7B4_9RHOB|nr:NADH-quinone oxidoreductase subunit E [Jannaschia seosinensis]CUH32636.1 NADH-quinone oxidoreductase chain 2 [Jannaschia seosinensis]